MKTQEEYAALLDEIIDKEMTFCSNDWFEAERKRFMEEENRNKAFVLGVREYGCDLVMLTEEDMKEEKIRSLFDKNDIFYVCFPYSPIEEHREIRQISPIRALRIVSGCCHRQGKAIVVKHGDLSLIYLFNPEGCSYTKAGDMMPETNRYLAIFRDANYYAGYFLKVTGKYYWWTDSGDEMEVKPEDLWAPIPLV